MKSYKLIYMLSLIFLTTSIYLIIQYPDSGRTYLIAGLLALIGFVANIFGYALKKAWVAIEIFVKY